jgi:ATP-dependent protease Clp ATPase subunit
MADENEAKCSFCGRKKSNANMLVTAGELAICDVCVKAAHQTVLMDEVRRTLLTSDTSYVQELKRQVDEAQARLRESDTKLAQIMELVTGPRAS